jgi:hypothetical protein
MPGWEHNQARGRYLSLEEDGVKNILITPGSGFIGSQGMYEITHYEPGTAILRKAMTRRDIEKLVIGSSTSIDGEGPARCGSRPIEPDIRSAARLRAGRRQVERATAELPRRGLVA